MPTKPQPNKIKPITPEQVKEEKFFHPILIRAVNELIKEKFNGRSSSVKVAEIKDRFNQLNTDSEWTTDRLFQEYQFDFEPMFRKAGWRVKYERPGWDESFAAYYEFISQ